MIEKNNFRTLSKILLWCSNFLLVLLPVSLLIIWLNIDLIADFFPGAYDVTTFDIKTQAYGMLFSLLPLSIWMYGISCLRRLFRNYAMGRVFLSENAGYITRFAWMSILSGGLSPVFNAVYSLILSMNHPAGQHILSIELRSADIQAILLGLVFVAIAHVMETAHRLSEENNQFV